MYKKISLKIVAINLPYQAMILNFYFLFTQILTFGEIKPDFIIKHNLKRKCFLEMLVTPTPASASHFGCMCVLSKYTLYVSGMLRHGAGWRTENRKSGWGTYTPYI